MVRKALMVMLAFVMMVGTLVTSFPMGIAYAENYISFSDSVLNTTTIDNPFSVNTGKLSADATLINADGSTISYKVEQITDPKTKPPKVGQSTTTSKAGLLITGSHLSLTDLKLFSGLNRVTFTGTSGGATFTQFLYVRYIDAPNLYDLTIFGSGKELLIKDNSDTVVTPDYVSDVNRGTIFVKGTAPNVKDVTVNVIDISTGEKKGVKVAVSSVDNSFTTQALYLKQGRNRLQFIVENGGQYAETYRDVVFYNGHVTFYNEQIKDDGSASASLRKFEPFYSTDPKKYLTGKVIVPNNYNTSDESMRVTAVYMQATNEGSGGTANVDPGESIVIEFNKKLDTDTTGGAGTSKDINDLIGFYYQDSTSHVIQIPELDTADPNTNNQSSGSWVLDTANNTHKYVISLGAADVAKFSPWLAANSKPFVLFKRDVVDEEGSIGIAKSMQINSNNTNVDINLGASEPLKNGDVLNLGTPAVPQYVIYAGPDYPAAANDIKQLHVVGFPGQSIPDKSPVVNLTQTGATYTTFTAKTAALADITVNGTVTLTPGLNSNVFTIPLSGVIDAGATSTSFSAGDMIRLVDPLGTAPSVYAIVRNYNAGGPSLDVYAPTSWSKYTTATATVNGYRLDKVTTVLALPASPIGGSAVTVGTHAVGDVITPGKYDVLGRASINIGTGNKAITTPLPTAGDIVQIATAPVQYAVVGLPVDSDGVVSTYAPTRSYTALPLIGMKGTSIPSGTQINTVTFNVTGSSSVSGDQRAGMDGKMQLKISSAQTYTKGDILQIGGLYALVKESVTTATTIPIITAPGAEFAGGAGVNTVTTINSTLPLGKTNVDLNLTDVGSLPFYVSGSFNSTRPSIIKATINASASGTNKIEEGESITVDFQNPAALDMFKLQSMGASLPSPIDYVVEGQQGNGDSDRATLIDLGLQSNLTWNGNNQMQLKLYSKGNQFFTDYGYLSFSGVYPSQDGGTVGVANPFAPDDGIPGTYATVLLGNTFDSDSRGPNPDVNNIIGTVLNDDFTAVDDKGIVPDYMLTMIFKNADNNSVLKILDKQTLYTVAGENYKETKSYFVFQFKVPLPTEADDYSQKYYVDMLADNTTFSPPLPEGTNTGDLIYLIDYPNKPLFQNVRMVANPKNVQPLTSNTQLSNINNFAELSNGTSIFGTPFAIEYQVIDPKNTTTANDDLHQGATVSDLPNGPVDVAAGVDTASDTIIGVNFDIEVTSTSPSGEEVDMTSTANLTKYFMTYGLNNKAAYKNVTSEDLTGDNVKDPYKSIVFLLKELPFKGTQTLTFKFRYQDKDQPSSTPPVEQIIERTVTYMSGPYVTFDSMYDGQIINVDSTELEAAKLKKVIEDGLGKLRGEMRNVQLDNPLYFEKEDPVQRVYLYVNNYEVPLVQGSAPTKFNVKNETAEFSKILKQLVTGENKITFLYKSNGPSTKEADIYKKEITIKLVSTNIPVVPVTGTDIYPYSTKLKEPKKDSKLFKGQNGLYTTTEKAYNVFGTFDFIDLGTSRVNIDTKLSQLQSTGDAKNYILEITKNDGTKWTWDLTKQFQAGNSRFNSGSSVSEPGLSVEYITDDNNEDLEQTFKFNITNEDMPKDGTKVVYTIRVYNSGLQGAYAQRTLEVSPSSTPYTIIRPTQQEMDGTINRNYVEVIIEAKGADEVLIDKVIADQIDYDSDNNGSKEYEDVFRAVVTGLKPNKKNTIKFTITKGSDKTTGQFDVMYAEDMIPGAEYMELMKSAHKVFAGGLELTFPKNTYLRRMDPKSPNLYKTQLYSDHQFLFGIANPEDGVVNRYDYVDHPSSFDTDIKIGKQLLQASFDKHFTQVSPMYWIDAGLADDPDSEAYDDVKTGFLPHQLPAADLPNFDERRDDLMLVPTQRGKIKMSYDKNVVADASVWLTVFRFDPDERTWTNIGGTVDPKTFKVTANFDRFGYYVVAKMNNSFTDVTMHPYARNHVEAMYVKGILKPQEEKQFGVDVNITRAEFATMIVKAMQIPLNFDPKNMNFDDVPTTTNQNMLWDYRYIETAANMGILRGSTPRIFEPTKPITREDASVILSRALQLKQDTDPAKVTKDLQKLFKDYNLISAYSRSAVLAIAKKKYVNGSPIDENNPKKGYIFEPNAYLLRGDASIIIANIMKDLKTLPAIQAVR